MDFGAFRIDAQMVNDFENGEERCDGCSNWSV